MICVEDRRKMVAEVDAAHRAGARLTPACELVGIRARTIQRWKAHSSLERGDGRAYAMRPLPGHALTQTEREQIVRVANESRFAQLPAARIVPMLADEGTYIASESSFHRVLRAHGQLHYRGRARAPQKTRPPSTHIATTINQVWTWDMTFLPAEVLGRFFYLYLVLICTAARSSAGRCMRGTVRIMRWIWCVERRWRRRSIHCRQSGKAGAAWRQWPHPQGHHSLGDADVVGDQCLLHSPASQ